MRLALAGTFLIVAAAGAAPPKAGTKDERKPKMTYPTYFASPRRDSASPAETSSKGEVGWKKDLELAQPAGAPRLLVWKDRLVADGASSFAVFSLAGERLWDQEKMLQAPIAVDAERVVYESRTLFLSAVDAAGKKVIDNAPLPGLGSSATDLTTLWPQANDYVSTAYHSDPSYDEENPGDNLMEPLVIGRRAVYGAVTGKWGMESAGVQSLPPLYLPEQQRLLIAQEKVAVWDVQVKSKTPAASFGMPLDTVISWSASAAGTLVIAGGVVDTKKGDHKAVAAVGLDGAERWRWSDSPKNSDSWSPEQPPIAGGRGRVLLLTSQRVLCLDKGKLAWSVDLADEVKKDERWDAPSWATALADGSLLLAAGATVRLMDAEGKTRWKTAVGAAVTAPPVVGGDGKVYVVTDAQLIQLK